MNNSESIIKISPALLKAQKSMGSAVKDAKNPFFKSSYADLGAVMEVCKGPLNENGILVLQPIGHDENGSYVETMLLHESGEYFSDKTRIVSKSDNNPQDFGSAITYARRYGLQSMLFIPAEDDDAERATDRVKSVAPKVISHLANQKQISTITDLLYKTDHTQAQLLKKYEVNTMNELTDVQAATIIKNLQKLPVMNDDVEIR